MKLTEQDKQTLRDFGHPESDMRQLCEAARRCKYTDEHGNRLTAEKAIGAVPKPASFANIARLNPHSIQPQIPPEIIACGLNASFNIKQIVCGTW